MLTIKVSRQQLKYYTQFALLKSEPTFCFNHTLDRVLTFGKKCESLIVIYTFIAVLCFTY